jgi:hypothetical protein
VHACTQPPGESSRRFRSCMHGIFSHRITDVDGPIETPVSSRACTCTHAMYLYRMALSGGTTFCFTPDLQRAYIALLQSAACPTKIRGHQSALFHTFSNCFPMTGLVAIFCRGERSDLDSSKLGPADPTLPREYMLVSDPYGLDGQPGAVYQNPCIPIGIRTSR